MDSCTWLFPWSGHPLEWQIIHLLSVSLPRDHPEHCYQQNFHKVKNFQTGNQMWRGQALHVTGIFKLMMIDTISHFIKYILAKSDVFMSHRSHCWMPLQQSIKVKDKEVYVKEFIALRKVAINLGTIILHMA